MTPYEQSLCIILLAALVALCVWAIRVLSRKLAKLKREIDTQWEWINHFDAIIDPEEPPPHE